MRLLGRLSSLESAHLQDHQLRFAELLPQLLNEPIVSSFGRHGASQCTKGTTQGRRFSDKAPFRAVFA
jgi:hypothetical protein